MASEPHGNIYGISRINYFPDFSGYGTKRPELRNFTAIISSRFSSDYGIARQRLRNFLAIIISQALEELRKPTAIFTEFHGYNYFPDYSGFGTKWTRLRNFTAIISPRL